MKQTVLRFVLKTTGNPMDIMSRFHPQGQTVLNRTEWRGKEPRSCAVTSVKGRPSTADLKESLWDVEVSYRPKGTTTYLGNTKYDGWTAMLLDRANDGTLLNGHGKPLPEGQPPVYLPFEMYKDVEFNEIDFGEFIEEVEVEGITHVSFDDLIKRLEESPRFNASMGSAFMAPRKQRPNVKVILSNAPSHTGTDGFGTRIIHVSNFTPQLKQAIMDHLTELMNGFLEGRYSIKNMSTDEFVFVDLGDSLVDCTPNEEGKNSRFNVLHEYVPDNFLEELAQQLMATYEVEVSIVDGREGGLLLTHLSAEDRRKGHH